MNLNQIEYIMKIAEEQNITTAAKKLYISQPALNQQLLNLEKELGVALFERSRNHWNLTEAGRIYLEAGEQILQIKRNAYAKISDIADIKREKLAVGMTPGQGDFISSQIYQDFHRRYPQIRLQIQLFNGKRIQKSVAAGELDLGIITIGSEYPGTETFEELFQEEMVVVMSDKNTHVTDAREENGVPVIDLQRLRDERWVFGGNQGMNHQVITQIFRDAGFSPLLYNESGGFRTRMMMVRENHCLSIIEEHSGRELPDGVRMFYLNSHPELRVGVIYKKGRYLSKATREFINDVQKRWRELLFF